MAAAPCANIGEATASRKAVGVSVKDVEATTNLGEVSVISQDLAAVLRKLKQVARVGHTIRDSETWAWNGTRRGR